ncbi:hypothetical protein A8A54_19375 [Brucella pseudogrignonensis]|uniref:hypothetical protein n=1 Tax=Brucella pseudogrignonensis TaxID=419475 RepID=UPI0007DAAEE4|nr:hypothetical protein [Brucella pseudogrignonensis]ANG98764.1 hypothetical protein A8A54_19375 [Brucella pseudogrignonensis]
MSKDHLVGPISKSRFARLLLGGAMIWLSASCSGLAEEHVDEGWKKQPFDFGAPDLRGDITVPVDATLQMVAMQPRQPGMAGHSTVVGKMAASATVPAEVTVMAFDLEYPAAPSRVCAYEADVVGLDVVSQSTSDDLSAVSLRSVRTRNGAFEEVAFTRCLTRGNRLLVFHFAAKPNVADEAAAVRTGERIENFAATMFKGVAFADGEPISHWRGMTDIPLKLSEKTVPMKASEAWTVAINDFNGAIPAELHLVRKRDGKDAGLVWLSVLAANGFDLALDGEKLLRTFIASQSSDFGEAKLLSSDRLPPAEGEGHRFRFEIPSKSGAATGELLATLRLSSGRVHTVAWWSPSAAGSAREKFMAQLPGLTTYDLAQEAMNRLMATK